MEDYKTEAERKKARFWQRFFTGAESADVLRFLTLNSSDESVVLGLDILDSFRKFVKRARRRYGVFEYFAVVGEAVGEPLRKHIHAICKGVYMEQRELEDMWVGVHRSIKPYIKQVRSVGGAAGYLGKYLHGQSFRRYIMSAGWVFPCWVSWSKWMRKNFGIYPSSADLVRLARLPDKKRDEIVLPDLMKMDRQRGQRKRSRALEHKRPLTAGDSV